MHASHPGDTQSSAALQFPFPRPPAPGKAIEVAQGVYWFSTVLPFRLRAVNLWLLRDGDCWTMVDCGFPLPEVKAQLEAVWESVLQGLPITRLLITHHHPDHVGNCRWTCQRWGILPTLTARERKESEELMGPRWPGRSRERIEFFRRHGLDEETAADVDQSLCRHRALFVPFPERANLLHDGDLLRIGEIDWRVLVAGGHSSAQALLYSCERKLLISGDQVLPQITPNVSVYFGDPEREPLSHFLQSNRRIAKSCAQPLVLPSHKLPFLGLQARVAEIERHHAERLRLVERELKPGPRTAASLIPALFGDPKRLTGHEMNFALGESVAHLHYLAAQGRAASAVKDGVIVFRACQGSVPRGCPA